MRKGCSVSYMSIKEKAIKIITNRKVLINTPPDRRCSPGAWWGECWGQGGQTTGRGWECEGVTESGAALGAMGKGPRKDAGTGHGWEWFQVMGAECLCVVTEYWHVWASSTW